MCKMALSTKLFISVQLIFFLGHVLLLAELAKKFKFFKIAVWQSYSMKWNFGRCIFKKTRKIITIHNLKFMRSYLSCDIRPHQLEHTLLRVPMFSTTFCLLLSKIIFDSKSYINWFLFFSTIAIHSRIRWWSN